MSEGEEKGKGVPIQENTSELPPGFVVTLEVVEGPDRGLKFQVTRSTTILGRKDADLQLTDPTVSGRHAVLEVVGGKLFLTDQKSTNGTKVNGEPIESAPVFNGDEIMLGDTRLLLSVKGEQEPAFLEEEMEEDTSEDREEEATAIRRPLPHFPLPENLYVVLEVIEGPSKGKKFKVAHRSTVIGRGKKADFQIQDPEVSLRHCQIEIFNKDKMTIKDLASTNGTRLNGHYISAVKIRDGDLIQIGDTKIKIMINIRR